MQGLNCNRVMIILKPIYFFKISSRREVLDFESCSLHHKSTCNDEVKTSSLGRGPCSIRMVFLLRG
jgi:hypothetical protein